MRLAAASVGAFLILGAIGATSTPALASDGCLKTRGYWYCYPGARPGVPWYGPDLGRGALRRYGPAGGPPPSAGYYPPPPPPGYYPPRRDRNPCPQNWTIQDGVCKPYRGF
jgi:hypothetical protein